MNRGSREYLHQMHLKALKATPKVNQNLFLVRLHEFNNVTILLPSQMLNSVKCQQLVLRRQVCKLLLLNLLKGASISHSTVISKLIRFLSHYKSIRFLPLLQVLLRHLKTLQELKRDQDQTCCKKRI